MNCGYSRFPKQLLCFETLIAQSHEKESEKMKNIVIVLFTDILTE